MIFHFILARKHGEAAGYPVAAAFDDAGLLALVAKYNELTSGDTHKAFAAENGELLFATVDGESISVRHTHQFADPSHVESRRQDAARAEALRIQQEQNTAQANLAQAQERLDGAKKAIRKLTPEQKDLLAEHAESVAAAQAAGQPRELPNEAEQQAERDRIAAATAAQQKAAAKSASGATEALTGAVVDGSKDSGDSGADSLDSHTVDELKAIAANESADLTGLTLKADIIAAIELNRAPLEDRTVEQLKDLATREEIDLTGQSLKADIIAAIEAHRAAPPTLPPAV